MGRISQMFGRNTAHNLVSGHPDRACLPYTRGGRLIWLGGHFEEAVFNRGPYLLISSEKIGQKQQWHTEKVSL